ENIKCERFWHLHPDWNLEENRSGKYFFCHPDIFREIHFYTEDRENVELIRGRKDPPGGLFAPRYGMLEECLTLKEEISMKKELMISPVFITFEEIVNMEYNIIDSLISCRIKMEGRDFDFTYQLS
ncbi:MAG: hypothetical protein ACOCQH_02745, partial [Halanaerobiales bacterium]